MVAVEEFLDNHGAFIAGRFLRNLARLASQFGVAVVITNQVSVAGSIGRASSVFRQVHVASSNFYDIFLLRVALAFIGIESCFT